MARVQHKDVEFFEEAARRKWKHARIAAFGSTRRPKANVAEDGQVEMLVKAKTPVVTFFGKSWKLHVAEVLRTTVEENRCMIRETASPGAKIMKSVGDRTILTIRSVS